jgi:hypothetical protein
MMSLQQHPKIACPAVFVQRYMSGSLPQLPWMQRRAWVANEDYGPRPRPSGLSASAGVRGWASGLSASAEVQGGVPELSASAEAQGMLPRSSDDFRGPPSLSLQSLLRPRLPQYDRMRYDRTWASSVPSTNVEPRWMRLREHTIPLFPDTTTISAPTHRRELVRGLDNVYDGAASWYLCDIHRYVCNSPRDETWFLDLQAHFVRVAQMRRDMEAASAAQLSESSEAGHADAFGADPTDEVGEEEEEVPMPQSRRLKYQ